MLAKIEKFRGGGNSRSRISQGVLCDEQRAPFCVLKGNDYEHFMPPWILELGK